jgi:integral membrane protein
VSPLAQDPQRLFRRVAVTEAVTWGLLLSAMTVKYGTPAHAAGEDAVRVCGMVHGVVFIAYCLLTLLVGIDQRWSRSRLLLGLASSVPPFVTVWFDRYAERRGALGRSWRLVAVAPQRPLERPAAWLLRNPVRGALAGLVAVAALTGVALLVGPPAG